MDEIDAAEKINRKHNEDALAAVRSLVPEEREELTEDDLTCEICGEPDSIQPARARMGYTCCTSCSAYYERQSKQYNRSVSRHYDYD